MCASAALLPLLTHQDAPTQYALRAATQPLPPALERAAEGGLQLHAQREVAQEELRHLGALGGGFGATCDSGIGASYVAHMKEYVYVAISTREPEGTAPGVAERKLRNFEECVYRAFEDMDAILDLAAST